MGINDGVLVFYPLAKIQLRGTDRPFELCQ